MGFEIKTSGLNGVRSNKRKELIKFKYQKELTVIKKRVLFDTWILPVANLRNLLNLIFIYHC